MSGSQNKGVPALQEARNEALRRIELAKTTTVSCPPQTSTHQTTKKGA
jgi:hypothetical protein